MAGTILNTRVDPEVLEEAEKILKTLGISRSAAINMFYRMVILKKGYRGSLISMKRNTS